MEKIKILHILHSFGIGGMEKGITMLVNHAAPEFEHMILCLSISGDSKYLVPPETPIYEMHKTEGNSIPFLWNLSKVIRQINPDVVHTRNWGGIDGVIAARLAGCKAIVHGEHGWGMDDPQGSDRKRVLARRWLSLGITEFTAVSRQIKNWLENDVRVHRPVNQIYNGVERLPTLKPPESFELRQELGLSESSLLLGTVGRLDPIKDHAGLMSAFVLLRQQIPDCHLLIIGDGSERKNLEKLKSDGVHLLGMRRDVAAILQSLDVFVLPSLNEGISNTILEAMAAGLPVVATSVGGTPELIRHNHNGLLVEARDYPALAKALVRYLNDPKLRAKHGKRNHCIIGEKFSISSMVAKYETIWKRVAGQFREPVS